MFVKVINNFKSNSAAVYFFSNVIYAGIPFLLLPLVTRFLTPAEYGEFSVFQVFALVLMAFIGVSVRGNAVRKYFEDRSVISEYIGSCVQVLVFLTVLMVLLLLFFGNAISDLFDLDVVYIYMAVIVSFCMMVYRLQLGQYQARGEAWHYLFLQTGNAVANGLMVLVLVVFLDFGIDGQIASVVFSSAIVAIFSVSFMLISKSVRFEVNFGHYLEIFRFGLPLLPHILSGALISTIDRYYISLEAGNEQLGIYMVAVQMAMALNLVFDAYNKYNMPFVFSFMSGGRKEGGLFFGVFYGVVVVCFFGFSFFCFFDYFGVYLVGESFSSAISVLPFLVVGQCFNGVYYLFVNQILYEKKTILLSLITFFSLVVHVCFLLVFVPKYGIVGAGAAFSISQAVKAALCIFFSIRLTGFSLYKKRY